MSNHPDGSTPRSAFPAPPALPRINDDPERLIGLVWQLETEDARSLDVCGLLENISIYQALIDHAVARQAEAEALLAHRRSGHAGFEE
ncbi:hypothetical protein [Cellulomonas sp. URHD0024]|uniref:hypothetical protein n=1 Tax=Cellulomonas sp. URHD0024 TaxID=1302620 RepID=UPI0004155157|nr:hypothetical protein [Cellulomonas sp. URHD0024]